MKGEPSVNPCGVEKVVQSVRGDVQVSSREAVFPVREEAVRVF